MTCSNCEALALSLSNSQRPLSLFFAGPKVAINNGEPMDKWAWWEYADGSWRPVEAPK